MMHKITYILMLTVALFAACENHNEHKDHRQHPENKNRVYTCPMHPEIIRNAPGQCPVCGMDLVENRTGGAVIENDTLAILLKPTNQYVISQVKTIRPQLKQIPVEIDASGKISYDTREVNAVSTRVAGRIDKLYVRYRYQPVVKGEKLMDMYSKELVTEQENYIYLLNNDAANQSLIKAAENRLLLLGLTSAQLKELKAGRKSIHSLAIYSPYTGHLHDLTGSEKSNDMSVMTGSPSRELTVKEGMYVEKGQTVFTIYNTGKVWAILNIYPEGVNRIKVGQKVVLFLNTHSSNKIEARIDFIEPVISGKQNTAQVRAYLDNTGNKLKIGTLVKATIEAGTQKGFFVPSSAIVHLGNRDIVFIKEGQVFTSKWVVSGIQINQQTEILSGISGEETLAENAPLLMDSESFIKVENE